jgi:hypothetical protein
MAAMGRIADVIADALVAEVKKHTEWDEPPALCFVYVEGGRGRVSELPLPEAIWSVDRPPLVLARCAEALGGGRVSDLLQRVALEGLHGAAFRCEAWEVDGGRPGTAQRSEAMAEQHAGRLHLHPGRREIRSLYAVDRAGITYAAVQRRGEEEVRRSVVYPKPGGDSFTGTIPSALDRIVTGMLGVSMPPRMRVL